LKILIKYLKPIYYTTAAYSFGALVMLEEKPGGGPCSSGIALYGVGSFLLICIFLTSIAISNITKQYKSKERKIAAVVLSILSLLLWGFWSYAVIADDILFGLICFLPLIISTTLVITLAIKYKTQALASNVR
jgi:hypothetical protein